MDAADTPDAAEATRPLPRGRDYVIVFGAAVRPGGLPSAALRHRVEGARAWAERHPDAMVIATGAVGRSGPAEAEVIARLLRAGGIADERILIEPCGRDTLESVRLCDGILRRRGDCARVICCTSSFHQPRCALLLRLLGYRVAVPPMPGRRGRVRGARYAALVAKEVAATPYDALLLLARRAVGRR
jgi:uncharacterized SAM-binding protein YcdF (DUF218 family)